MAFERVGHTVRVGMHAGLLIAALGVSAPAWAAEPTPVDRESARALMDEGDARFDSHNYEAALQAYDAANAIMHVPTTGYAVAKTLAALGRLVEARDAAMLVTHLTVKANETQPFVQARAAAESLSNEVQASIASLAITVEGVPNDDVRVDVDGIPVPAALLQLARKTDPGSHVVHATAPGYSEDRRSVTLGKGESAALTLKLQRVALPEPPVAAAAPRIPPPLAPVPAANFAMAPREPSGDVQRMAGTLVGSGGVVLLAVGAALALSARSKYLAADCDSQNVCEAGPYQQRHDALVRENVATVVIGVGAAAVASGVVMYVLAPTSGTRVGLSARGAVFEGAF